MRSPQPSRAVLCRLKSEVSLYRWTILGTLLCDYCYHMYSKLCKKKHLYMFLYAKNSTIKTHEDVIVLVMSREECLGKWGRKLEERHN